MAGFGFSNIFDEFNKAQNSRILYKTAKADYTGQGGISGVLSDVFGGIPGASPVDPSASAAPIPPAKVGKAAQMGWDYFTKGGYSPVAASGILGNFMQESGFNPTIVGDGGASVGLGQWNGPRLAALKAFAAQRGGSPSDPAIQYAFADQEIRANPDLFRRLNAAKTPAEASAIIMNEYERPKAGPTARATARASYANNFFKQFGGGAVGPTLVADTTGGAPPAAEPPGGVMSYADAVKAGTPPAFTALMSKPTEQWTPYDDQVFAAEVARRKALQVQYAANAGQIGPGADQTMPGNPGWTPPAGDPSNADSPPAGGIPAPGPGSPGFGSRFSGGEQPAPAPDAAAPPAAQQAPPGADASTLPPGVHPMPEMGNNISWSQVVKALNTRFPNMPPEAKGALLKQLLPFINPQEKAMMDMLLRQYTQNSINDRAAAARDAAAQRQADTQAAITARQQASFDFRAQIEKQRMDMAEARLAEAIRRGNAADARNAIAELRAAFAAVTNLQNANIADDPETLAKAKEFLAQAEAAVKALEGGGAAPPPPAGMSGATGAGAAVQ